MKNIIVVHTTVEHLEDAEKISQILLDKRLIACAQIDGPIHSIYRWEESIENAQEYRLSVKSTAERAARVMETIQANHPYEVAEITGHRLEYCSSEYQDWLIEEVEDVSS